MADVQLEAQGTAEDLRAQIDRDLTVKRLREQIERDLAYRQTLPAYLQAAEVPPEAPAEPPQPTEPFAVQRGGERAAAGLPPFSQGPELWATGHERPPVPPVPSAAPAPVSQAALEAVAMAPILGTPMIPLAVDLATGTYAAEQAAPYVEKVLPGQGPAATIGKAAVGMAITGAPGALRAGIDAALAARHASQQAARQPPPPVPLYTAEGEPSLVTRGLQYQAPVRTQLLTARGEPLYGPPPPETPPRIVDVTGQPLEGAGTRPPVPPYRPLANERGAVGPQQPPVSPPTIRGILAEEQALNEVPQAGQPSLINPPQQPVAIPGPIGGEAPTLRNLLTSERGSFVPPGSQVAQDAIAWMRGKTEDVRKDLRAFAKVIDPQAFASAETLDTLVRRKGEDIEGARFRYNRLSAGNEAFWDRLQGQQGVEPARDFLNRMSVGAPQATPELQRLADFYTSIMDDMATRIREVRPDFEALRNYVPGIWKDREAADKVLMARGRRPLEGSKNFIRQKFYLDRADALAAGLEPVTENPETLFRTYLEDVRRYLWAQHVMRDGIETGRWQWVPGGRGTPPEGKAWLDDAIAERYFPPGRVPLVVTAEDLRQTLSKFAQIIRTQRVTDQPPRTTTTTTTTGGGGATPASAGKIEERVREALSARGFQPGEVDQYIARLKAAGAAGETEAQTTIIREITEKVRTILQTEATQLHLPAEVRTVGRVATGAPVLAGRYAIDEGEAQLLKNFLSKNWFSQTATVRGAIRGNALLNGLQLGLSGFHAVGETINAWASHSGLVFGAGARGVSAILRARPGEAAGHFVHAGRRAIETPFSPLLYLRNATKLWNDPVLVDAVLSPLKAGARLAEPTGAFHTGSAWETFRANLRRREYGSALLKAPAAAIDATMRPLFEVIIPRMKVGSYLDLVGDEMIRRADELAAGTVTPETVAREAWKAIENRYGRINYDNLFWNRTFQAAQHLLWRAVGWNHGTIRELGGAAFQDTPAAIKSLVTGQGGQFTPKMQYTLGLTFSVATLGAIYQYLHTGEPPQELKDYFFPKNGQVDAEGNEIRVRLPTYFKDIHAVQDVKGTIVNKLSPEAALLAQLWQNRDFFGDYIWNPNDVLSDQGRQVASYLIENLTPFSVRQYGRLAEGQSDPAAQLEAFLGITTAPKSVIESPIQTDIRQRLEDLRGGRGPRTPQLRAIDRLKATVRAQFAQDPALAARVDQWARGRGQISDEDADVLRPLVEAGNEYNLPVSRDALLDLVKSSRQTRTQRQFQSLPRRERDTLLRDWGLQPSP